MNKAIKDISSDSSSGSYSSDDSLYESEQSTVDIFNLISWNSLEGNLSNFSETFKQFSSDEKTFLIKSRCLNNKCTCNFKNYDLLLARVFVGLKVLVGKWSKLRFSKTSIPDTDKIATFMFFKEFQGWYEVMNENLEVIPFWNNVSQIVQNKPKSFLLRKDSKCLYIKDSGDDANGPITFENTTLKGGTVLNFVQCRKYCMRKGRRTKEQFLAKCKDSRDSCFYFIADETLYTSPIAGFDNISGAHSFPSIIEKFHFPINVKPILMVPPVPTLPCSDRHFLQLTERFQLDLIVVTPVKDCSRLFLLTPSLFNDHVFTIGEFLPSSVTGHALPADMVQNITAHKTRLDNFFSKCHKFENLSYLLKHAEDTSKTAQKFEMSDSEFDEIYVEVEGIYFFIRNGYFPRNAVQEKPKNIECVSVPAVEPVTNKNSTDNDDEDESDEDGDSTDISSTSTESGRTSSTAMNMCKQQRVKLAKSMPLGKSKDRIENSQYGTSNSRGNLNLTVDDMVNLSLTGVCVPDDADPVKRVVVVPKFYQGPSVAAQRFLGPDAEMTSLKDTMV